MAEWERVLAAHMIPYQDRPWLVAISGGCDSVCLYHMLKALFPQKPLVVLHANHQLHPEAPKWAQFVQELAQSFGDAFHGAELCLDDSSEDAARQARYAFFEQCAASYHSPVLLLAHHADDNDETSLWRFLRGSPLEALVGMPSQRPCGTALLLRPLLSLSQSVLKQYAQEHHLQWVIDPSNTKTGYTRNFLRHKILFPLRQRDCNHIASSRRWLSDQLEALNHWQQPWLSCPSRLSWKTLAPDNPAVLRCLIQSWLVTHQRPQLSYSSLHEFVQQLLSGAQVPQVSLGQGYCLASFQGQLWYESVIWWQELPPEPQRLEGTSGQWGLWHWELKGPALQNNAELRRLRKKQRLAPGKKAQEVWDQHGIPPWRRPFYPLLCEGEHLVQYADIWGEPRLKLRLCLP